MDLTIRPADKVLRDFVRGLSRLSESDGRKALVRAVNRTTSTVYTRVIRGVVKQSSIPRAIVVKDVNKQLARVRGSGEITGLVTSRGKPVALKHFKARQFSFGVKAKVWGKQRRFETMFIDAGKPGSGRSVANGHVFQRKTSRSLPIQKQFGPSVPAEMVRGQARDEYRATVETMLPDRVRHEIKRLIPVD